MSLLEVNNLSVQFGGLKAISDFSFSVENGALDGIIGPNGAGKTTVFNVITGVVHKAGGSVVFDGKPLTDKLRPDIIANYGISRTFQNIRLFSKLSVLDNVCIAIHRKAQYSIFDAFIRSPKARKIDRQVKKQAMDYLDFVGLTEYADKISTELPYGVQRRVEIARAIATKPKLLLLDEPAAGMNAEEAASLSDFIRALHKKHEGNLSILLIEHHLEFVYNLCDQITVMNLGTKLASGTPEVIFKNEDVVRAYIGERRNKIG